MKASSRNRRPIGLLAILIAGTGVALLVAGESSALEKMSASQLAAEYESVGLATAGTPLELRDGPRPSMPFARNVRLDAVHGEILRRGPDVVPELVRLLENEAPQDRPEPSPGAGGLSLTADLLALLEEIGDPRCVPTVLRILEGWEGQVSQAERFAALTALEKLTMVCFYRITPHYAPSLYSVEHPDALDVKFFQECDTPARLYRKWLEGEGKEPKKWREIALGRARQLLESPNLDDVYCAAFFLRPEAQRDDAPDATVRRLAELVAKFRKEPGSDDYRIDGRPVPVSCGNWVRLIADYGPRARPYAAMLLRIQKEQELNDWSGYSELRKIGGAEIVSHLISVLPKVSAEADKILSDPESSKGFSSDDPRLAWISSQREVRFGIDRWAGRLFESDAERLAWWEENKSRLPREWLEDNLDTVAGQLVRKFIWARWIAYEVLPDLPGNEIPRPFRGGGFLTIKPMPDPFAGEWLRKNRDSLRYDESAGCFRLGS